MHPVLLCALLLWPASLLAGDARQDWAAVTALDSGPGVQPQTAAEAFSLSIGHIEKQEKALRTFLAAHSTDARAFEATLRLVRLLDLRAEMRAEESPEEAATLMGKAGELATTPELRTEFEFALLTRRMRKWRNKRPPVEERRGVLEQARKFETAHPADRRLGSLLAEIATLFDTEPKTKKSLLNQARKLTKDPALIAQISDDLKRLGFLGKPIPLRFTALDGRRIDAKDWQGRVVAILFFSTWSAPARAGFIELRRATDAVGAGAEFIAVSLDTERAELEAFLRDNGAKCPVAWDGKGWDGPLIQALGINAVPTAWLLDRKGVLRSLDALEQPEEQIRKLLRGG
jgi:hypothetical protein